MNSFRNVLKTLSPGIMLLVLLNLILPIMAQEPIFSFAADDNGTLIYIDRTGKETEILIADAIGYMTWNDDGTQLAFVVHTQTGQGNDARELGIMTLDNATGEVTKSILQTHRLAHGYNISWTRDGRVLFVQMNSEPDPETNIYNRMDIFAAEPGGDVQQIGTFVFGGDCGGGSSFPADWRYYTEIGGFGGFLTLEDTPYGILYSTNCSGSELALMHPQTGESTVFASNFTNVVVSPDREYAAGIEFIYAEQLQMQVAVAELATGEVKAISTEGQPDVVAWSEDGNSLYYSVRSFDRNLVDDLTNEERNQLNTTIGYEVDNVPANSVTVYHVDLTNLEAAVVYHGDAYAILRIAEVDDIVYLSRIQNMGFWLGQIISGEIDYSDYDANMAAVQVDVLSVEHTSEGFGNERDLGSYELFTPVGR